MKQNFKKYERKKSSKSKKNLNTNKNFHINKFFALFLGIIVISAIIGYELSTYNKLSDFSYTEYDTVYASADVSDNPIEAVITDGSQFADRPDSANSVYEEENGTLSEQSNSENIPTPNEGSGKIAYLTFDDGPSSNVTPQILDILNSYNIKATFFVLGTSVEANPQILRRIYAEGHRIANHSYSHVYKNIYSSVGALLNEINYTNELINNTLGMYYGNTLFRFPGGSFDKPDYFKKSVTEMGFKYVDWNCLGNDAVSKPKTADEIYTQTVNTSINKNPITILLHDTNAKQTTVDALPRIIEYLIGQGYEFKTLENN